MSRSKVLVLLLVSSLAIVGAVRFRGQKLVILPEKPAYLAEVAPIPIWQSTTLPQDVSQSQLLEQHQESKNFVASFSAQSLLVLDVNSGSVLLEKNAHEQRFPASTTKLITALLVQKSFAADEVIEIKEEAFTQGTVMNLKLGEKITVKNLLSGLLIASGNDAAFALANHYPGGYPAFILAMNNLAQELHLTQTHFLNPSGLDVNTHLTTATDLGRVARQVLKDELLKELVGTRYTLVTDVTGEISHPLESTNQLLGSELGVIGMKTGTTLLAGEVLVTAVENKNRQLVIVLMGSQDRYGETKRLIEWSFSHYDWLEADELTRRIKVLSDSSK